MHMTFATVLLVIVGGAAIAADASLSVGPDEVFGPDPKLDAPNSGWWPTMKIADPIGWRNGEKPVSAPGLEVSAFATGLDHPRWLYLLPDGDVLVAESNAPPKHTSGLKSWIMSFFMAKAGAGTASANRITRLTDNDGDGKADKSQTFLGSLNSPFGMALVGEHFYVANADAILRFDYKSGAGAATGQGEVVAQLPGGPRNHHWTKNIIASRDGQRLLATVGSNSNVGENGLAEEGGRAAIWEVSLADKKTRMFATGLRNPNGLAWKPDSDELWTVVNERDELGDNLVPDYLTSVKDGAFYGWPQIYFGDHADRRAPADPSSGVGRKALKPDYALGAHTASLGLAFSDGKTLSPPYASGAFIGQHGSWNRSKPAGYRVIFVPFKDGRPQGKPEVVLGGFLDADGRAHGRPVGVIADGRGGLLVADDVGNTIWRVTATAKAP
jgi:glucose/arabinose dehydrogenase